MNCQRQISLRTFELLATFRSIALLKKSYSPDAITRYLISGCESEEDIFGVVRLAAICDVSVSACDADPGLMPALLFESIGATDRLTFDSIPFDEIIPALAAGKYDAGLIIHEGQLTFQNQGLHLVVDLGVWWQDRTGLPLPLGGNRARPGVPGIQHSEILLN